MVIDVILFSEDDVLMKYILELCFKLFFFIKKIFKKMIRIKILRWDFVFFFNMNIN